MSVRMCAAGKWRLLACASSRYLVTSEYRCCQPILPVHRCTNCQKQLSDDCFCDKFSFDKFVCVFVHVMSRLASCI